MYFVKAMAFGPSYVAAASYGIKHSLLKNVDCLIMHFVHGLTVKNGIKLVLN